MARGIGARGVKVKRGFGVEKDLALLRSVRRMWKDGMLAGDTNGAYDPTSALRLCAGSEDLEKAWLEEPVPP